MQQHLLFALSFAALVNAHGFMSAVVIDGKEYKGPAPNANPDPSIIRQVKDISPVFGAGNKDINCGLGAANAQLVADANPGSKVEFVWSGGGNQNWPHNTGPMLTYMTSCGSTPCNEFNTADAKWFKIQEIGRKPDGNHEWAQVDVMKGASAAITLPNNLASGHYIMRHEIIALHNAGTRGLAEFYPACAQINVGGNQNGKPTDKELVTFPGGYTDDDPGIWDKQAFDPNADYAFPGPPIAAFVSGGGGGGDGSNDGPTTSRSGPTSASTTRSRAQSTSTRKASSPSSKKSGTSPTSTAVNVSSQRSSQCRLVKNNNDNVLISSTLDDHYRRRRRRSFVARSRHDLSLAFRTLFSRSSSSRVSLR